MTADEVAALITYVDTRIEEEIVSREDGEDGYRHSARREERLLRESAAAHLRAVAKKALDTVK